MNEDEKQHAETELPEQVVRAVIRKSSPGRTNVYVNSAVVLSNQWDIQFYFGFMYETEPGKFETVDQVMVVMNLEHALAFSKALQRTIQSYEKTQGKIREIKPIETPKEKPVVTP